ncbi:tripartite tricarboxylate transporter permease [Halalkalibacter oceani]|uniref:tripartite tricarboxylate transporter permease n=1 Tax=Halalkalibacter oceani TaxID=1653776 RepID=UPI0033916C3B
MSEIFSNLLTGFGQMMSLETLLFAFLGVLIGTLIGILPGIGPITAIALLIPMSYGLAPVNGLILLCGIYYGSMYGGSITSILVRTPGDVSAVVVTLDGYEMAKQGRAKPALATSAIGSFVGGTVSVIGLMTLAPVLANAAQIIGSAEYFLLMILAITMVTSFTTGSRLKAYLSTLLGLAIATIGIDLQTGQSRFTFGIPNLLDGIDFVLIAIALFAVPEALMNVTKKNKNMSNMQKMEGSLWMTKDDWKRSGKSYGRGSVLGFLIGVLPGIGPSLASFMSYAMEKKVSKRPQQFGKGAIEGVAGPEAANNAAVGGAFVPLFTLGIPGSATTALLLVIFMMYGLQPGPAMMEQNPDLIWAIIASMYVGNIFLLILNLPLVGLFASILKLPSVPLYVGVLAFAVLGVYGLNLNQFDLMLLFLFGLLGIGMQKFGFPLAPLVLSVILGPLIEQNLSRAISSASGNWLIFFERPVSLVIIVIIGLVLILPAMLKGIKKKVDQDIDSSM